MRSMAVCCRSIPVTQSDPVLPKLSCRVRFSSSAPTACSSFGQAVPRGDSNRSRHAQFAVGVDASLTKPDGQVERNRSRILRMDSESERCASVCASSKCHQLSQGGSAVTATLVEFVNQQVEYHELAMSLSVVRNRPDPDCPLTGLDEERPPIQPAGPHIRLGENDQKHRLVVGHEPCLILGRSYSKPVAPVAAGDRDESNHAGHDSEPPAIRLRAILRAIPRSRCSGTGSDDRSTWRTRSPPALTARRTRPD